MKRGQIFVNYSLLALFLLSLFSSFVSAGQLKVTNEHPFYVNGSWVTAGDLKVGDLLTTEDGKQVRITSLEDIVSLDNFSVYNLEAGIYHNFIVNGGDDIGVVVHNSDLPAQISPKNGMFWEGQVLEGGSSGAKVVEVADGSKWVLKKMGPRTNPYAEVLTYELDNFLGTDLVPKTVLSPIRGEKASLQKFIESGRKPLKTEFLASKESEIGKYLDYLTWNYDRMRSVSCSRLNNVMKDGSGKFWLIDNAEGFGLTYNGAKPLASQLPPVEMRPQTLQKLKELRGKSSSSGFEGYDYSLLEKKFKHLIDKFPMNEVDRSYVLDGFKERVRLMIEALE